MKYPPTALFVESPWYGVLEIVGEPDGWRTECWNGKYVAAYVTETLKPLTPTAMRMLHLTPDSVYIWSRGKREPLRALALSSRWPA